MLVTTLVRLVKDRKFSVTVSSVSVDISNGKPDATHVITELSKTRRQGWDSRINVTGGVRKFKDIIFGSSVWL